MELRTSSHDRTRIWERPVSRNRAHLPRLRSDAPRCGRSGRRDARQLPATPRITRVRCTPKDAGRARCSTSARDRVAAALGARRERDHVYRQRHRSRQSWRSPASCARLAGRGAPDRYASSSITRCCAPLDGLRDDGCDVTLLPVDARAGSIPTEFGGAFASARRLCVSVMYANNEIGTVQPIGRAGRHRPRRAASLFHTDAVQAPRPGCPIDVRALGVDLLSLSAAQVRRSQGRRCPLRAATARRFAPLIPGGGQEFGRRSGTENVAGVVGMAAALELAVAERPAASRARRRPARPARGRHLRGDPRRPHQRRRRASGFPTCSNASFAGIDSEALLIAPRPGRGRRLRRKRLHVGRRSSRAT